MDTNMHVRGGSLLRAHVFATDRLQGRLQPHPLHVRQATPNLVEVLVCQLRD